MARLWLLVLVMPAIAVADAPRTTSAECLADVKEYTAWSVAQTEKAARELCDLRATHATVLARLDAGIARLEKALGSITNHDHAQNLPRTIASIRAAESACEQALASQQFCHNIACLTQPESNAIFCETQAVALVDQIVAP